MKKLGFGVIGLGVFGQTHVLSYAEHPFAELVTVCDLNEDLAKATAEQHNTTYYIDYHEMLEDPKVEAISVVTPDFLHKDPVIAAAEAGKHILCEKPLAPQVKDAEEMVKAVEKAGITFMVDFHNRWSPPFVLTKEAVDKGELGTPVHANLRLCDTTYVPTKMLSWAAKSSVLWFLGSHCVDLAQWMFNDEIAEVYAVTGQQILTEEGIHTPDFYQYIACFKKGAVTVFENSWILPETMPLVVDFVANFTFSKGCVSIDPFQHGAFKKYTYKTGSTPDILAGPIQVHGRHIGFAKEAISHFVDCLIYDRTPVATAQDGLAVTKVLCAVEKSAEIKQPVAV